MLVLVVRLYFNSTFLYVQNKREVKYFCYPIRVCQNFRTYKYNLTLDCVEVIITIVFDRCMVYVNLLFNFAFFISVTFNFLSQLLGKLLYISILV